MALLAIPTIVEISGVGNLVVSKVVIESIAPPTIEPVAPVKEPALVPNYGLVV